MITIPESERTLTCPIEDEVDTKRTDQLAFIELAKSLLDSPLGISDKQYEKMIAYMRFIKLNESDLGEVKKAFVTESYNLLLDVFNCN